MKYYFWLGKDAEDWQWLDLLNKVLAQTRADCDLGEDLVEGYHGA